MTSGLREGETSAERRRWRVLAVLVVLTVTGLRLAYLAWACPLDLAQDEAHYWDWSRHLDWSYYSKGPLVAWLIRASGMLTEPWLGTLADGETLAVRLPAVVCGSLLLLSLYVLTVQVFGRDRLAFGVVVLGLTFPLLTVGALLMTIDSPYACCWGWALILGYQAALGRSWWAWPLAGLLVGLGILAKYTMVLWLPSLGLFLLTSPGHRRELLRPGFWLMTAVAAFCCLPILVWNLRHDWVTLLHVNRLAGLEHGTPIRWLGPLAYLGTQFALLLGIWFGFWLAAMVAHRPWREADAGRRYLWWMSAPMFVVFLGFSLKTGGGEANWPVTAYLSGLVLTAGWLATRRTPLIRLGLGTVCALGLVVSVLALQSTWFYPILTRLSGPPGEQRPLPLRRFDPSCRLRGWRTLAREVDRVRAELGADVVLAATNWALPGELAFYCEGRPAVFSLGEIAGDRRSQYDLWRPNPVQDPEQFAGKTFVVVSLFDLPLGMAFEAVEPPRSVTHYEQGQPLATWTILVCRGFRGFPKAKGCPAGRVY